MMHEIFIAGRWLPWNGNEDRTIRPYRLRSEIWRACLKRVTIFHSAEKLLDRARAIDGEAFAPDSLRIARDWNDAAALAAARKRYPDAERMLRQSLAIADGQLPVEHPRRAEIAANLAEVLYAQKRFAEAENLFKASLEILERAEGPLNPRLVGWLEHYAEVLHRSENYAEAERVRLRATRIRVENTLHPR